MFWQKNYKLEPGKLQYTQVADGPDMVRARTVKPLLSYWFYKDQAKKMLDKYHVDIADQKLVHALHASQVRTLSLKLCQNLFTKVQIKLTKFST